MQMKLDIEFVRTHTRRDGNSEARAILRADGMERFFHYTCKGDEEEYIEAIRKNKEQITLEVQGFDTNYSDTINITGKLVYPSQVKGK